MRRPGTYVTGNGQHQGDSRSAWSAVPNSGFCALGRVSGPGAATTSGASCTANGVTAFQQDGFTQYITVEACSTALFGFKQCFAANVNKPH